MYYLLFIIYLCMCCYVISRSSFIKSSLLSNPLVMAVFLLKVAAGLFVGWVTKNTVSDSWAFNTGGWMEYKKLVSAPGVFFYEFIQPHYITWNDLPENLLVKGIALLDVFTRGNYYINTLFFTLAGFFGCAALYKVFHNIYPQKKWPLVTGCFLLPSAVIFTSAIHKDVIIFTMLAFFCYALYFSLNCSFNLKKIFVLVFTLLVIFLLRSYVAIVLAPCALAWVIAQKTTLRPWRIFALVYGFGLTLLLILQVALPSFKPLQAITDKQAQFFNLPTARTQLASDSVYPSLQSLAKNTPQALNHSLLRPYVFEFNSIPVMNCFALEMMAYLLLFILMLIFYKKQTTHAFILFCVFFAFSMMLIIGYTVTNAGAITRYRSIYFPFLITPVLCFINWQKIKPGRMSA